ncbi:zinc finger homeobox protein 4-like [Rhinatrema bivittatum]|uniref:zinc finger homeobox protein 4-like n=1 Tax=Rhinatrema bivittatum TaxID=194408 RepID=UPI00112B2AA6|nr:zinc finger homeobox protein 4-like [Rhinatrema bivittatum]
MPTPSTPRRSPPTLVPGTVPPQGPAKVPVLPSLPLPIAALVSPAMRAELDGYIHQAVRVVLLDIALMPAPTPPSRPSPVPPPVPVPSMPLPMLLLVPSPVPSMPLLVPSPVPSIPLPMPVPTPSSIPSMPMPDLSFFVPILTKLDTLIGAISVKPQEIPPRGEDIIGEFPMPEPIPGPSGVPCPFPPLSPLFPVKPREQPSMPKVLMPSTPLRPDTPDTWDDTATDTSSEEVLLEPSPPEERRKSPPEDLSFSNFIKDMADTISFQLQSEEDTRQKTLEVLQFVDPPKEVLAIPIHEVLVELLHRLWEHPCSIPPVNKRTDSTYLVQHIPGFQKTQLPHQSVVVESAQKKSKRIKTHSSTPPGKDNRFLDNIGRKMFQGSMLLSRIASYQLYMTQYQRNLWKQMQELFETLPQQVQDSFSSVIHKGLEAGKHEVRAAYDSFETASRMSATGISARRWAWLKGSDLRQEIQEKLADLPCVGDNLFGVKVKEAVSLLKEHSETLKQLSSAPQESQTPSRRLPRKESKHPYYRPRRYYPSPAHGRSSRPTQRAQSRQPRAPRAQPLCKQEQHRGFEILPESSSLSINPIPNLPVEGQIAFFQHNWSHITTDQWVLTIISQGYHLDFLTVPNDTPPTSFWTVNNQSTLLQTELSTF